MTILNFSGPYYDDLSLFLFRWTNVKRALFRFINLVPAGSRLTILSMGAGEEVREVGTMLSIIV